MPRTRLHSIIKKHLHQTFKCILFAGTLMAQAGVTAVLMPGPTSAFAQCTELGPLQNFTGAGQVVCPCFVVGEEAGAVLNAPAGDYPIKILRIGVGWGSQFGGQPDQLEQAIHIYPNGLPNPGVPIYSLLDPVLSDGFINEFDISAANVMVNSGPFTVTLEFLNQNAGNIFAPSVVHDGNGCIPGKNVVFAIPGGWNDACLLGVTGDWVFYVDYETCPTVACAVNCPQGDADGVIGLANKSPDLDASGLIGLVDVSLFAQVWQTNDYCADFDCDGFVGLVDVAILAQHFQHFGVLGVCN